MNCHQPFITFGIKLALALPLLLPGDPLTERAVPLLPLDWAPRVTLACNKAFEGCKALLPAGFEWVPFPLR
jgi:hypothetical protein